MQKHKRCNNAADDMDWAVQHMHNEDIIMYQCTYFVIVENKIHWDMTYALLHILDLFVVLC